MSVNLQPSHPSDPITIFLNNCIRLMDEQKEIDKEHLYKALTEVNKIAEWFESNYSKIGVLDDGTFETIRTLTVVSASGLKESTSTLLQNRDLIISKDKLSTITKIFHDLVRIPDMMDRTAQACNEAQDAREKGLASYQELLNATSDKKNT